MALRDDQAAARLQNEINQSVSAEEYQQFRTLSGPEIHANLAWLTFGISLAVTGAGSLLYHFDGASPIPLPIPLCPLFPMMVDLLFHG